MLFRKTFLRLNFLFKIFLRETKENFNKLLSNFKKTDEELMNLYIQNIIDEADKKYNLIGLMPVNLEDLYEKHKFYLSQMTKRELKNSIKEIYSKKEIERNKQLKTWERMIGPREDKAEIFDIKTESDGGVLIIDKKNGVKKEIKN